MHENKPLVMYTIQLLCTLSNQHTPP